MNTRRLLLVIACALSATTSAVSAQPSPPALPRAASAPLAVGIGPRLISPAQAGENASPAGDLRPERPVTPQINIPLGRKLPAPEKPAVRALPNRGARASTGGVDDAAARCEAESDDAVRAKCRDKSAHETRTR